MTKSILFGVALSAFASAAAYASPAIVEHTSVNDTSHAVAAVVNDHQPSSAKRPMAQLDNSAGALVVAENRREFGSQYQRER
jgi:hypothetical protein